jgi:hypothetical protein
LLLCGRCVWFAAEGWSRDKQALGDGSYQ